jgi:hypothetical protein
MSVSENFRTSEARESSSDFSARMTKEQIQQADQAIVEKLGSITANNHLLQ